jgi:hypothetical protein
MGTEHEFQAYGVNCSMKSTQGPSYLWKAYKPTVMYKILNYLRLLCAEKLVILLDNFERQ